jgi:membrane protease YdiL (CAAX protease family)
MSILAGIVGLGAVLTSQSVRTRLIPLPSEPRLSGASKVPLLTLLALVVTGAIVAGVSEEAGFRGYMQGMIERRRGPVIAILVTGSVFGLAHFSHPQVGFANLPYYIAVAAVYGSLAHLTGSIMPGLVLHAVGNTLDAVLQLIPTAGSLTSAPERPVWESGPDTSFFMHLAWAGLWCLGAIAAYRRLAHEVRKERPCVEHPSLPPLQLLR